MTLLALARAIEYHVLHGFASQVPCRTFSEHPTNRIDDVRLAAAVRANDADDLPGNRDVSWVHEGLEPGEFDFLQAQWRVSRLIIGGKPARYGVRSEQSSTAGWRDSN